MSCIKLKCVTDGLFSFEQIIQEMAVNYFNYYRFLNACSENWDYISKTLYFKCA
jgi:hypothetical protein